MIELDAARPVHFCDGLTRRDFLHAGALGLLGLSLPDLRAEGRRAPSPDKDVNCIMLFLVGAPSQLDTWDMKPDAPGRDPRAVQADRDERARHPDQRDLPAHGEARGQVRARPLRLPHRRGRPRHRPPDDADRPAVHRRASSTRTSAACWAMLKGAEGRRPAARAAAAADRQHRRQHAARPDGGFPGQGVRPVRARTPIPPIRTSRCPTCCRPTTSTAVREPTGAASCATLVDGAVRRFEASPTPGCWTRTSSRRTRSCRRAKAREAFDLSKRARRRRATGTAGTGSARAACSRAG